MIKIISIIGYIGNSQNQKKRDDLNLLSFKSLMKVYYFNDYNDPVLLDWLAVFLIKNITCISHSKPAK